MTTPIITDDMTPREAAETLLRGLADIIELQRQDSGAGLDTQVAMIHMRAAVLRTLSIIEDDE